MAITINVVYLRTNTTKHNNSKNYFEKRLKPGGSGQSLDIQRRVSFSLQPFFHSRDFSENQAMASSTGFFHFEKFIQSTQ